MNIEKQNWDAFALLLIDVQRDFWPDATARAFPDFPANITNLLTLVRTLEIDVVHLRAKFRQDQSDWMKKYRIIERRLPCIEDTPGVEVLPFATEEQDEKIIIKQTFDGFCRPELDEYLQRKGKRFLLVAGLVTSVCVLLTSASAAQRGYLVGVVEDCCADNPEAHKMVLSNYPFIFDRVNVNQVAGHHRRWLDQLEKI